MLWNWGAERFWPQKDAFCQLTIVVAQSWTSLQASKSPWACGRGHLGGRGCVGLWSGVQVWFTCVLFVTTGYIEAAVIPAGARRIRVVEDKPAHSFLGKTMMI